MSNSFMKVKTTSDPPQEKYVYIHYTALLTWQFGAWFFWHFLPYSVTYSTSLYLNNSNSINFYLLISGNYKGEAESALPPEKHLNLLFLILKLCFFCMRNINVELWNK